MTQQRASELLAMIKVEEQSELTVNSWWGSFAKDYKEALQMAIKALEQQLCEDCISRQAVNDGFKKYENGSFAYGCVRDYINKLPFVTPKEKIGKWIKYGTPRDGEQHYQCTNCKWYVNFGQWGDVYTKQFKYCPNCGARMVSE